MENTIPATAGGVTGTANMEAAANSLQARKVWYALRRADRVAARLEAQLHYNRVKFLVKKAGQALLASAAEEGLAVECLGRLTAVVARVEAAEAAEDRAYAAKARQLEECRSLQQGDTRTHLRSEGEAHQRKPVCPPAIGEWARHAPDFRQPWYDGDSIPFEG